MGRQGIQVAVGQHQQILHQPRHTVRLLLGIPQKGGAFSHRSAARSVQACFYYGQRAAQFVPGCGDELLLPPHGQCRRSQRFAGQPPADDRQQQCASEPDRTILHNCLDRMTVYKAHIL